VADPHSTQSLSELLSNLARDFGALVRQEVRLAGAEMTLKARSAGRGAMLVVSGGVLTAAGLLSLVGAGIAALSAILPVWLSALLVGVAVLVLGFSVARAGLAHLRRIDPLPEQTIATIREDVNWVKEQAQ